VSLFEQFFNLMLLKFQLRRIAENSQGSDAGFQITGIIDLNAVRTFGQQLLQLSPGKFSRHFGNLDFGLFAGQDVRHENRIIINLDDAIAFIGQISYRCRQDLAFMNRYSDFCHVFLL